MQKVSLANWLKSNCWLGKKRNKKSEVQLLILHFYQYFYLMIPNTPNITATATIVPITILKKVIVRFCAI